MSKSQAKFQARSTHGLPLQRRYVAPQAQLQLMGALDVANRRATFVASCGSVDSFGTRFVAQGLLLDRLRKNPVFLWQHNRTDPDDAIGKLVDIRLEGDRLIVVAEFAKTDLAERCWQAVLDGRVNAVSIGFDTLASHAEGDIVVIDSAEVYEVSLCLIGSNPDALALRAFIEGKRFMNPDVLKTLGLADGASPDEIVKALIMYLAKTDEDKALAAEALKGLESRAAESAPSASSASDGAAAAATEARADEMAENMRKLSERMAQLEARSKPEHIAAAVRAELAKGKAATAVTAPAPAKRSALGLRMFAGGNPAKPAGAAPAIGPQTGSAAKGIMARVDAQLAGRSE